MKDNNPSPKVIRAFNADEEPPENVSCAKETLQPDQWKRCVNIAFEGFQAISRLPRVEQAFIFGAMVEYYRQSVDISRESLLFEIAGIMDTVGQVSKIMPAAPPTKN